MIAALPVVAQQVGVVVGQLEYVYAAYVVTWLFVIGYAGSLFFRFRESRD